MTLHEAIRSVFAKYMDLSGRAPRSEFWWFFLFVVVCNVVLNMVDTALFGRAGLPLLGLIFGLAIVIPFIAVAVRRLHDREISGWWMFVWIVPFIGALIVLVLCALPGTKGRNRFGADPLALE